MNTPFLWRLPPPGLVFPPIQSGGGPIFGALNPFQFGPAVIDPGELYFQAGYPIGGPVESYRGVTASRFPFYFSVLGPGAPLSAWLVGVAGEPISG
jgi:hypothetical protein